MIIFNFKNNIRYVAGNSITYQGIVSENQTTQTDILESPFFPNFYPRDLTVEHLIECVSNDSSECHIEISFTDFQIALPSTMEVIIIIIDSFIV